jgi:hypothetical protein
MRFGDLAIWRSGDLVNLVNLVNLEMLAIRAGQHIAT